MEGISRENKDFMTGDIPWRMASLRLARAAIDRVSPRMEVVISADRGEGCQIRLIGLFDTGAEVTCCSNQASVKCDFDSGG